MAEAHEDELEEVLTAAQLKRVRQIYLQSQGLFALKDPTIVKELGLTSEQRSQIRDIEREMFARRFERGGFFGGGGPGPRMGPGPGPGNRGPRDEEPGRRPDPKDPPDGPRGNRRPPGPEPRDRQLQQEVLEKALAVLTFDQRAKWDELVGEKFSGPLDGPGFGPPRR
jgi:hypothetical protein